MEGGNAKVWYKQKKLRSTFSRCIGYNHNRAAMYICFSAYAKEMDGKAFLYAFSALVHNARLLGLFFWFNTRKFERYIRKNFPSRVARCRRTWVARRDREGVALRNIFKE